MNSVKYLYAAYLATWLIHAAYLSSMVRRYAHLHQQMKELHKSGK